MTGGSKTKKGNVQNERRANWLYIRGQGRKNGKEIGVDKGQIKTLVLSKGTNQPKKKKKQVHKTNKKRTYFLVLLRCMDAYKC